MNIVAKSGEYIIVFKRQRDLHLWEKELLNQLMICHEYYLEDLENTSAQSCLSSGVLYWFMVFGVNFLVLSLLDGYLNAMYVFI